MAVEAKRGCGYRKAGGLYLVGGGLSAPCDRMPFLLERCKVCGGGIKFTRGPQWLQPGFFSHHESDGKCVDDSPCPVCQTPYHHDFGPLLLLWIGRGHYTPEAYLKESRELGVSRRLSALPKGLVLGETWVLLAHLDAVPTPNDAACLECGFRALQHPDLSDLETDKLHKAVFGGVSEITADGGVKRACDKFQSPKPTPGIFCAFVPRAVELILKQSDATPERVEKEAKRGVTVVEVPDDDKDHQGSVWSKEDEDDSQPELPGVHANGGVT